MTNGLPDYKRKALERSKASLLAQHEAVSTQHDNALEAGQRVKLKAQLADLERQLAEIDAQLEGHAPQSSPAPQPRKRVSGIPTELSTPLKNTLLQCGDYLNAMTLPTVLAHEMLTPWRYSVPVVSMLKSQVDMIIAQLADQYRTDGQNALVIFLQVLAENYDEANQLHEDLLNLAKQLATYK